MTKTTTKGIEALQTIAAAGEHGVQRRMFAWVDKSVKINGNTLNRLRRSGLVREEMVSGGQNYYITEAGRALLVVQS